MTSFLLSPASSLFCFFAALILLEYSLMSILLIQLLKLRRWKILIEKNKNSDKFEFSTECHLYHVTFVAMVQSFVLENIPIFRPFSPTTS